MPRRRFRPAKVRLTLDWKPEPEFGGFYAAKQAGEFEKHGLDVDIKPAGAGAPTWQLVATGKTEFATTAADQVLIARAQGADVVALFAVYQTCPQGIMVRKARGFTKLADVFANPGTLAAENNAWLQYCRNQFQPVKVTLTGYAGGVGRVPREAGLRAAVLRLQRADPRDEAGPVERPADVPGRRVGLQPVHDRRHHQRRNAPHPPRPREGDGRGVPRGLARYLDDPSAANKRMSELNTDMDLDTFTQGAAAQKPLIETEETKTLGLGAMTAERWTTLGKQLVELKVIPHAAPAEKCFVDVGTLK